MPETPRPKTVVLGVTGSIAAYKACEIASQLTQAGVRVWTIFSVHAARFVTALSFQALTGQPVLEHGFQIDDAHRPLHTRLADEADLMLIAPATADCIGKLAAGLADDLVSTTALAVDYPVWIAPAMNQRMYRHRAVQRNLKTLEELGYTVLGVGSGHQACGHTGPGRMLEPADLVQRVLHALPR